MREQIPTSGDIIVDDQVINKLPRKDVPFLEENGHGLPGFRLIDKMNVLRILLLLCELLERASQKLNRVLSIF